MVAKSAAFPPPYVGSPPSSSSSPSTASNRGARRRGGGGLGASPPPLPRTMRSPRARPTSASDDRRRRVAGCWGGGGRRRSSASSDEEDDLPDEEESDEEDARLWRAAAGLALPFLLLPSRRGPQHQPPPPRRQQAPHAPHRMHRRTQQYPTPAARASPPSTTIHCLVDRVLSWRKSWASLESVEGGGGGGAPGGGDGAGVGPPVPSVPPRVWLTPQNLKAARSWVGEVTQPASQAHVQGGAGVPCPEQSGRSNGQLRAGWVVDGGVGGGGGAVVVVGGGGGEAVTSAAGATEATLTGPYSVDRPGSMDVIRAEPSAARAAPNAMARAGVVAGGKRTSAARVEAVDATITMPGDAIVMATLVKGTPAAAAMAARNLL